MTQAATLEVYGPLAAKQVVQLRGRIGPSDASRLAGLIKIAVENGHLVPSLSLDSLGGTFEGSVGLAQVVRTFELSTYVEDGAQCASACFLVFAAGKKKFASYGARIGVHAVKDSKGDADRAATGTEAMRRILTALAVPLSITKRMADTPNDKMAWLSIPELRLMGVSVLGRSEPSPLEVALPTPAAPQRPLSEPEAAQLWERLVRTAARLSARQHGGLAQVQNACTPEACTSLVSYTSQNQEAAALRTTRDRSRKIIRREVCDVAAAEEPRCRAWSDPAQTPPG